MGNRVSETESLSLASTYHVNYSSEAHDLFDFDPKDPLAHVLLIKASDISDKDVYRWFNTLEHENETPELDVLTYKSDYRIWHVNKQTTFADYFYRKLVERRKYKKAYILIRVSSEIHELKSLALVTCFKIPTTIIGLLETKKRKISSDQGNEEARIHEMKYVELPPATLETYIAADILQ
jgi:hypothetical protein